MNVKEEVKKLLREELNLQNMDDDQLLFGVAGGFDSLTLLNFILGLENTFDIIIADDDLVPENFISVDCIVKYISDALSE